MLMALSLYRDEVSVAVPSASLANKSGTIEGWVIVDENRELING